MNSNELNDNHIGGDFTATITGKITGFVRYPDFRIVNVDPGLPGGTLVQIRVADDDPIEVEATEAEQPLNPAPTAPDLNGTELDADGNPIVEPEAGE